MSQQSDAPPKASEREVKAVVETFLGQIDSAIDEFKDFDDPSTQEAVRQLRDIKGVLEGTKQVEGSTSSWDWKALSGYLLQAADWIRFLIDLYQNYTG